MNDPPTAPLMRACGAQAPLSITVEGPEGRREVQAFDQPFVLAGRALHNDLVLDDPSVSDTHAYFQVIDGRVYCVDLDSSAGTFWAGGPRRGGWVGRQTIEIGPFRLTLAVEGARRGPPFNREATSRGLPDESLPQAELEFHGRSASVARWRVDRLLTLAGRSNRCKLCLDGAGAAPFLFSLLMTPAGLWMVRLSSAEALFGENSPRFSHLRDGDSVRVGRLRIKVYYPSPSVQVEESNVQPPAAVAPAGTGSEAAFARGQLVPAARGLSVDDSPAWPIALPSARDAEIAARVLAPVMEQFNRMQEHMLDQFQQVVVTMAHVFSDAHREHKEFVRSELDELQALTKELQTLREQLAALPTREAADAGEAPTAAEPEPSPVVPQQPDEIAGAHAAAEQVSAEPAEQSADLGTPEKAGDLASVRTAVAPAERSQPVANGELPASPARQADPSLKQPRVPRVAAVSAPDAEGRDIHDWLAQRILEIQTERQSRWRKLLQILGMSN